MPGVQDKVVIVTGVAADSVATPDGAGAVVATAIHHLGAVHGVVNNAGILRDGAFHKMTAQAWDAVLKGFEVPRRVVFCAATDLPTTPTGKVQKFRLVEQLSGI